MFIKCNADVLSGGSVLVDLPGTFDTSTTILRTIARYKDKLDFTLAATGVKRSEVDASLMSE